MRRFIDQFVRSFLKEASKAKPKPQNKSKSSGVSTPQKSPIKTEISSTNLYDELQETDHSRQSLDLRKTYRLLMDRLASPKLNMTSYTKALSDINILDSKVKEKPLEPNKLPFENQEQLKHSEETSADLYERNVKEILEESSIGWSKQPTSKLAAIPMVETPTKSKNITSSSFEFPEVGNKSKKKVQVDDIFEQKLKPIVKDQNGLEKKNIDTLENVVPEKPGFPASVKTKVKSNEINSNQTSQASERCMEPVANNVDCKLLFKNPNKKLSTEDNNSRLFPLYMDLNNHSKIIEKPKSAFNVNESMTQNKSNTQVSKGKAVETLEVVKDNIQNESVLKFVDKKQNENTCDESTCCAVCSENVLTDSLTKDLNQSPRVDTSVKIINDAIQNLYSKFENSLSRNKSTKEVNERFEVVSSENSKNDSIETGEKEPQTIPTNIEKTVCDAEELCNKDNVTAENDVEPLPKSDVTDKLEMNYDTFSNGPSKELLNTKCDNRNQQNNTQVSSNTNKSGSADGSTNYLFKRKVLNSKNSNSSLHKYNAVNNIIKNHGGKIKKNSFRKVWGNKQKSLVRKVKRLKRTNLDNVTNHKPSDNTLEEPNVLSMSGNNSNIFKQISKTTKKYPNEARIKLATPSKIPKSPKKVKLNRISSNIFPAENGQHFNPKPTLDTKSSVPKKSKGIDQSPAKVKTEFDLTKVRKLHSKKDFCKPLQLQMYGGRRGIHIQSLNTTKSAHDTLAPHIDEGSTEPNLTTKSLMTICKLNICPINIQVRNIYTSRYRSKGGQRLRKKYTKTVNEDNIKGKSEELVCNNDKTAETLSKSVALKSGPVEKLVKNLNVSSKEELIQKGFEKAMESSEDLKQETKTKSKTNNTLLKDSCNSLSDLKSAMGSSKLINNNSKECLNEVSNNCMENDISDLNIFPQQSAEKRIESPDVNLNTNSKDLQVSQENEVLKDSPKWKSKVDRLEKWKMEVKKEENVELVGRLTKVSEKYSLADCNKDSKEDKDIALCNKRCEKDILSQERPIKNSETDAFNIKDHGSVSSINKLSEKSENKIPILIKPNPSIKEVTKDHLKEDHLSKSEEANIKSTQGQANKLLQNFAHNERIKIDENSKIEINEKEEKGNQINTFKSIAGTMVNSNSNLRSLNTKLKDLKHMTENLNLNGNKDLIKMYSENVPPKESNHKDTCFFTKSNDVVEENKVSHNSEKEVKSIKIDGNLKSGKSRTYGPLESPPRNTLNNGYKEVKTHDCLNKGGYEISTSADCVLINNRGSNPNKNKDVESAPVKRLAKVIKNKNIVSPLSSPKLINKPSKVEKDNHVIKLVKSIIKKENLEAAERKPRDPLKNNFDNLKNVASKADEKHNLSSKLKSVETKIIDLKSKSGNSKPDSSKTLREKSPLSDPVLNNPKSTLKIGKEAEKANNSLNSPNKYIINDKKKGKFGTKTIVYARPESYLKHYIPAKMNNTSTGEKIQLMTAKSNNTDEKHANNNSLSLKPLSVLKGFEGKSNAKTIQKVSTKLVDGNEQQKNTTAINNNKRSIPSNVDRIRLTKSNDFQELLNFADIRNVSNSKQVSLRKVETEDKKTQMNHSKSSLAIKKISKDKTQNREILPKTPSMHSSLSKKSVLTDKASLNSGVTSLTSLKCSTCSKNNSEQKTGLIFPTKSKRKPPSFIVDKRTSVNRSTNVKRECISSTNIKERREKFNSLHDGLMKSKRLLESIGDGQNNAPVIISNKGNTTYRRRFTPERNIMPAVLSIKLYNALKKLKSKPQNPNLSRKGTGVRQEPHQTCTRESQITVKEETDSSCNESHVRRKIIRNYDTIGYQKSKSNYKITHPIEKEKYGFDVDKNTKNILDKLFDPKLYSQNLVSLKSSVRRYKSGRELAEQLQKQNEKLLNTLVPLEDLKSKNNIKK
ncbi:putative uncharacterized protein DDB_G0282133 [Macrosteles quadrilineatus]|uniref:putative uncharacterized protein DDB_G0282133 n=1 Tax=Macrosteles quadrilineatus TaxID=74068 RepID=UPI0023E0F036|nr:putative uncharacterized protein DDB_G0282133 [Macrosteles quadrilineatus]